jgi:hypothetical protein
MHFWPSLTSDRTKTLADCPGCELEKARQKTAHGMFAACPFDAPRPRFAMDFQGQGLATTSESEALGIIDATSRCVTVLCLPDREATTFIPVFLDPIAFVHSPPAVSPFGAAPEFLSEATTPLAAAVETATTTALGHGAFRAEHPLRLHFHPPRPSQHPTPTLHHPHFSSSPAKPKFCFGLLRFASSGLLRFASSRLIHWSDVHQTHTFFHANFKSNLFRVLL